MQISVRARSAYMTLNRRQQVHAGMCTTSNQLCSRTVRAGQTYEEAYLQPEQAGEEADSTGSHPDRIQGLSLLPLALCLIIVCTIFKLSIPSEAGQG
jgi:hypothetical protein